MERKTNRQGVLVSKKQGKKARKGEKKGNTSRMSSKSVPHTQDSGFGTQEVPVDVHMEEDGGEGRTPRKRRPVQRYSDSWESLLSALTPSQSPMTVVV